ncbi:Transmembrane protein 68 [Blattella germanica]|nr:Transmembrane protein 68 [Blattella germanica]
MLNYPGYEVSGLENIPDDSPALIVYYHGAIPIDLYYFISKTFLFKNRLIHTVADRFLFKMPGMKLPVIPIFTQNLREAFRTVGFGRRLWLKLYSLTRFPLIPIYGGFPVKLRTHIGKPIPYNGSLTPEQLQIKVAHAIEELIEEHQRIPGSILLALIERVYQIPKKKAK